MTWQHYPNPLSSQLSSTSCVIWFDLARCKNKQQKLMKTLEESKFINFSRLSSRRLWSLQQTTAENVGILLPSIKEFLTFKKYLIITRIFNLFFQKKRKTFITNNFVLHSQNASHNWINVCENWNLMSLNFN